jgi:hypothetical protein
VIKNADKFGAKTEDFFEDQDLLNVDESEGGEAGETQDPDAFVEKSLRGGN